MVLFGILIALTIVTGIILLYWKAAEFQCIKTVPGPKPNFFLGNVLLFASAEDVLPIFCECLKRYGKTYALWIGPIVPNVVSADINFAKTLLCSKTNVNKSWQYGLLENWIGKGLLTSADDRWRTHRKLLTPAFHYQIMIKFASVMQKPTSILLKKLEENINAPSFNIYNIINLYALDVMCETSMGTSVNAQETDSDYVDAVKKMSRIITERAVSAMKQHDFFYKFTKDCYDEKKALKILHNFTNSVIVKRKLEIERDLKSNKQLNEDFGDEKKQTFLDLLLRPQSEAEALSDEVIREQVDTFLFAGHDTTSASISYTLYCLAKHPEVQRKALEEQVEIFGKTNNPNVSFNDLQNMKYLECVIRESLRLYPPVPFYGRELVEDMVVDGQLYPKGLNCYILAYAMHRDPDFFPNPDEFIPTRFLDMDPDNSFSNIPFSAGVRNCIGQKFAMLVAKYSISALLRNFEFMPASPIEEPIVRAGLVLRSLNGIKISIKKRSN